MVENVLLITIDSLRTDISESDAPGLVELTEQHTSFGRAFATGPGTTPSFPAILTGTYPLSYDGLGKLSHERPFLARELRSAGLATGGFHSNPFLAASFNYDTGFTTFRDYQSSVIDVATRLFPQGIEESFVPDVGVKALKRVYERVWGKPRPYVRAEQITDDAIDWLRGAPDGFFQWVHYMDVHHPCFPPRSYLREYGVTDVTYGEISDLYSRALERPETVTDREHRIFVDSYRASVRYVDDQIDRLLETLRDQGLSDETLVVLTSDHGQLFGEFDSYGKPYRMYDELLGVPLVIQNAPQTVRDRSSELVSLVDLPLMIHDALGVESPDAYEGHHLEDGAREWILAEHQVGDDVTVGVRTADEKYVVDNTTNEDRAYRIDETGETRIESHSVEESLRERVFERLADINVSKPDYVTEVDRAAEERLQDLGYL